MDVKDEAEKRKSEKEKGYEEIFAPRSTAYTKSGDSDNQGGRPQDVNDINQGKNQYDQEYNKNARGN